MAKGNDGNYLQHSIEIAIALHLVAGTSGGRLHVALAHGMAPYEPCGALPDGQARRLLYESLEAARKPATEGESSIVAAYRETNASLESYPNTGELLAAVIGRNRLSGGITETDTDKHANVQNVWSGSDVTPVAASWRCEVSSSGVLICPSSLRSPWLFSVDPMTYHEDGYADDDKLYRADLGRLSEMLKRYVASGQPGVAVFFVYGVKPDVRPQFWKFIDDLAGQSGTLVVPCWIVHQGGNANLAALLCSPLVLRPAWLPHGLNFER